MSKLTEHYSLIKPDANDYYDVENQNYNMDIVDKMLSELDIKTGSMKTYPKATGTATNIILISNYFSLIDGESITFIVSHNSNRQAVTLNVDGTGTKPIYKPGTTLYPNLKEGRAITLWYDAIGDCFFLKASAEGDATAGNVLAGKIFSNDDETSITGIMMNRGGVSESLPINGIYVIPEGYHNGNGTVKQSVTTKSAQTYTPGSSNQTIAAGQYLSGAQTIVGDADLVSANIKAGVNIFGVAGNSNVVDTSAGTANASQILSGAKAYVDGSLVTGTIPSKGAQTFTPGTVNQTIAANQYLTGVQTIAGDADLVSANIKAGVNIFGVAGNSNVVDTSAGTANASQILSGAKAYVDGSLVTGTIPSKGAQTFTPGTANQTIGAGQYLSGTQTIAGDADLVASKIVSTANIFGVQGAAIEGKRTAIGTGNFNASGIFDCNGLLFTPRIIIVEFSYSSIYYRTVYMTDLYADSSHGLNKYFYSASGGGAYITFSNIGLGTFRCYNGNSAFNGSSIKWYAIE